VKSYDYSEKSLDFVPRNLVQIIEKHFENENWNIPSDLTIVRGVQSQLLPRQQLSKPKAKSSLKKNPEKTSKAYKANYKTKPIQRKLFPNSY
jgi:hypothetical protein